MLGSFRFEIKFVKVIGWTTTFYSRKGKCWSGCKIVAMLGCGNNVIRVCIQKRSAIRYRSMSGRGFRPRSEARMNMLVAIILGTVSGKLTLVQVNFKNQPLPTNQP